MTSSPADLDRKQKTAENKLHKRLRREVGRAIVDYQMIEEGDRVMVCLSGGKDSYAMLDILQSLQRSAPVNFELVAVNLDQKQPGFPEHILPEYLESLGIEYYIVERDTYSVVKSKIPEGKTTCGLCSRLRRGNSLRLCRRDQLQQDCSRSPQGRYSRNAILNMFHGARMASMPPKLLSDDKRNIVIRPMAYCREKDILKYADIKDFPIIPCNLCGSQENLQRQSVKAMLAEWEREQPSRIESIFGALQTVAPSQLADRELFDFENLQIDRSDERPAYEYAENQQVRTRQDTSNVQFINAVNVG